MSPELERQPEAEHFRGELESILDVPLSPENIDDYADNALNELVELVQSVQASFQETTTQTFSNQRELENTAFQCYDLEDIEQVLDHVATKSEELRELDDLIYKVFTEQAVLVPPDPDSFIEPGEDPEDYTPARKVPRLKTLLFVLANEFELDVHDTEQVTITTGVLDANMVRGESYNLVDIPSLERCALICDEVGNITFVFDCKAMEEVSITPEDLAGLTKDDLKDLLHDHPKLGQTITYHQNTYVANLISTLNNIEVTPDTTTHQEASPSYLQPVPTAPDDVLSVKRLGKEWGIGPKTITKAIEELTDTLSEITQYKFGSVTTSGYNTEQQALIRAHLEDKGLFAIKAPANVFSARRLAKEWGVAQATITRAVDELGEAIGKTAQYKFGTKSTQGFTSEQKAFIRAHLEDKGLFTKAPANILSVNTLKEEWGVDHTTITRAVDELGEAISKTAQYKFGSYVTQGYTPEQQALIRARLESKGVL